MPKVLPGISHSTAITHFTIREERGIKGTQAVIDEYAPLYHVRSDARHAADYRRPR
jgi:hypothetical protein